MHVAQSRIMAPRLGNRGLIGKFASILPFTRMLNSFIDKSWHPLIKGKISLSFCENGFFTFLYEEKANKDLIFKNKPYFLEAQNLYLNQ